jgi:hypothetical protein
MGLKAISLIQIRIDDDHMLVSCPYRSSIYRDLSGIYPTYQNLQIEWYLEI